MSHMISCYVMSSITVNIHLQAMGKGGGAAYTFDLEILVREVVVKGSKCILMQKIGERKEHQFKFEVGKMI